MLSVKSENQRFYTVQLNMKTRSLNTVSVSVMVLGHFEPAFLAFLWFWILLLLYVPRIVRFSLFGFPLPSVSLWLCLYCGVGSGAMFPLLVFPVLLIPSCISSCSLSLSPGCLCVLPVLLLRSTSWCQRFQFCVLPILSRVIVLSFVPCVLQLPSLPVYLCQSPSVPCRIVPQCCVCLPVFLCEVSLAQFSFVSPWIKSLLLLYSFTPRVSWVVCFGPPPVCTQPFPDSFSPFKVFHSVYSDTCLNCELWMWKNTWVNN